MRPEWLTYEVNPRCEKSEGLVTEYDVVIKRLDDLVCCSVQKYFDRSGRILWRSLTPKRDVFRAGYASREQAAQELVRDCSQVRERMRWRRSIMARRAQEK